MTSRPTPTPALVLLLSCCACIAGLLAPSRVAAVDLRVDVVVDMTPMGRNVPRPTPENPVYYLPVPGGYTELGGVLRHTVPHPPPEAEVDFLFTRALAQQGYLQATPRTPPSLIITYTWGRIIPIIVGRGKLATVANEPDMLSMVAGDKADAYHENHPPSWLAEMLVDERRPQRFLKVMAFDFKAWREHRTVLLWQAHITTPGLSLSNIMPTLIAAAAPALGVETVHPVLSTTPFIPPGSVVVGVPVEKSP